MTGIVKLKLLSSRRATDVPTVAAPIAAAADEDDLPIPSDIKTVLLGGLFLLAMLGACYVASEIILPIVLAFVLSLLLQPAMRVLERFRVPRGLAAVFLILRARPEIIESTFDRVIYGFTTDFPYHILWW